MWLNVTWWHVRPSCTQDSFSIEDALDACERELGPLVGCAADIAGERTPLFKNSLREPNGKTSQTTHLGRKQMTQPDPDAGERKASTPDTTLIDWSIPVRLPSGTPMETWTRIPTSRGIVGTRSRFASNPLESRSEVAQPAQPAQPAQLESTDFLTPFRRSIYRLSQPPLSALQNATSLTTHIVPILMLPFGFWVAFGLLVTWR